MSDNIDVKNAAGVTETIRTTETGGVHIPHQRSSFATATSATILSLTTANPGTGWTAFGSQACNAVDIINGSSVAVEYRRGGAGNAVPILSGSSRLVVGITNANQIEVRRVDQSNTQATIAAEALTV